MRYAVKAHQQRSMQSRVQANRVPLGLVSRGALHVQHSCGGRTSCRPELVLLSSLPIVLGLWAVAPTFLYMNSAALASAPLTMVLNAAAWYHSIPSGRGWL